MFKLGRKDIDPKLAARRDMRIAQQGLCGKSVARLKAAQASLTEVADSLAYLDLSLDAINRLQDCMLSRGPGPEVDADTNGTLTYKISTVFIRRAAYWMVKHPQGFERMIVSTGIQNNNTVVLTEALKLRTTKQSAADVTADPGFFAATVSQLEDDGHRLWSMWHSHPTTGPDGTQPSGTDLAHQSRLANFGMPHVIGGICNRDGWFRLFNPHQDFHLELFGNEGVAVISNTPREKLLKVNITEGTNALLSMD